VRHTNPARSRQVLEPAQRQVRHRFELRQEEVAMRLERAGTMSADLGRRGTAGFAHPLRPLHSIGTTPCYRMAGSQLTLLSQRGSAHNSC